MPSSLINGMFGSVSGNILAISYFLFFQVVGVTISLYFFKREKILVRLLFGSVVGSIMLEWLPVLLAFIFGFTLLCHIMAAIIALAIMILCVALQKKSEEKIKLKVSHGFIKRNPFVLLLLAVIVFFTYLVSRGLTIKDGIVYSSQATYGDMSMHLGFITSIAVQGTFPPHYSILPQAQLSYPFLSDSISSSLYLFGASLKLAYVFPMVFAGAQVFAGMYIFAYRWLKDKWKAALAWILFFFCGGLGVVYFIGGESGNFSRIFTSFYQTPTNLVGENIRWVNVIVDMMLPQRATLFGWAVLFPVMYLLYRAVFEKEKRYFIYAGILSGLMPMIHTHSFLFLAILCLGWLIVDMLNRLLKDSEMNRLMFFAKLLTIISIIVMWLGDMYVRGMGLKHNNKFMYVAILGMAFVAVFAGILFFFICKKRLAKEILSSWGVYLLIVLAIAMPQLIIWTFRQAATGGFIKGNFNWANLGDEYLWFYLKNIGITSIFALLGLLFAKKENFFKAIPALFVWFVAEFMMFQPNEYDNNKLLYPAFMLLCCVAACFAVDMLRKVKQKPIKITLASALLVVTTISATLTMGRESVSRYEIYGTGATNLVSVVDELEPDATILTSTRHNNEIAALSGRNIVCGSSSYLYYHGINYYQNELAVAEIYKDIDNSDKLIAAYNVDYILVSDFERSQYELSPRDEKKFAERFELIYTDGNISLYKV